MSPALLSQLGPETHRVIAAAFIHERTFGKPMIPLTIQNLCQAEGPSYSACLVVILGKGLNNGSVPRPAPGIRNAVLYPAELRARVWAWMLPSGPSPPLQ